MRGRLPALAACSLGAALLASPAAAEKRETVLLTPGTHGTPVGYAGADPAGERVFIVSVADLTPDDTDGNADLYERRGADTTLVSAAEPGTEPAGAGGGRFRAMSPDGARIIFTTNEPLVPEDTDPFEDVYERSGGHTLLLSGGGTDFFGVPVFYGGASDGAEAVFFNTSESLMPEDNDGANDVYGWFDGSLHLMSVDAAGANFSTPAEYDGTSADGTRLFFATTAAVAPGDGDAGRDVYVRSDAATTLVTTAGAQDVAFQSVSGDGNHLFFESLEQIVAGDTDDQKDVYEVSGGQTELVSTGPAGGNGPYRSDFQRASRDGTRVYFTTTDHLVSTDTDDADDIFQRHAGETTIESHGPAGGDSGAPIVVEQINKSGTRMYFRTFEQLTMDDTDFGIDSYVRVGGRTERISIGAINDNDSGTNAGFAGGSENGERVFFTSLEPMTADDDDPSKRDDIYARGGGETVLVSTGPEVATNTTRYDAVFEGYSADGNKVWFSTYERLTADDEDETLDVYESRVLPGPPPPVPEESGGTPEQPGPPSENGQVTAPSPNPLLLASAVGARLQERDGAVTIPCRARNGRLRRCAATITPSIGGAARFIVIGRGSRTFRGRGRRAALIPVRLTRRGIALVRLAGGARAVTVRLRARDVGGRGAALRRRATLVLPHAYVLSGYAPGQVAVPHRGRAPLRDASLGDMVRDLAGARVVRCVGHTDGSATPAFARRLGLLRAAAVCRALAARGLHARLTAVSAGRSRPRATNATARGRGLNRRVIVHVLR